MAKRVALIFIVATLALGVTVGSAFWYRASTISTTCESVNDLRNVVHDILERSQRVALKNPDYTPREKAFAEFFYSKALSELEPTKC